MNAQIEIVKKTFNQFSGRNIEILGNLYDQEVFFQDPIKKVQGLKQLEAYYLHIYKNVNSINFDFQTFINDKNQLLATWIMKAEIKGLNDGKPFQVEGNSVFVFNKNGKVIFQRDYFDLGQMIYENLFGLGAVVRKVKSILKADI